jgi:hypothetical protein
MWRKPLPLQRDRNTGQQTLRSGCVIGGAAHIVWQFPRSRSQFRDHRQRLSRRQVVRVQPTQVSREGQ